MDFNQLQSLVAKGESNQVEFKKTTGLIKSAFESLCAFLNNEGGIVIIGVSDNGAIVGQEVTDKIQQTIAHEISKIEPPTKIEIAYVPLNNSNKFVIVLKASACDHGPFFYEGRPFIREQTVTKRMPQQLYDRLISKRTQKHISWERLEAIGYSIEDIDEDLVQGVVRAAVNLKRMPEVALRQDLPKVLESLDLMKEGYLTNAALVLFGKRVKSSYPQCQLQLARFKGVDRNEFLDIDECYGNIFELIERALVFVRRHLPIAAKIMPNQLERVETPMVPFEAIREGLYNAFCHRDYTIYGGSVGLAIYDDRMEIFSHGGLYDEVTIEKIKSGFSRRRNPVISDIFYRANLIEKWGRGIQKMISSCLEANDPEPEFYADSYEFKVTFRFPNSLAPLITIIKTKVIHDLTFRQNEILTILEKEEELSTNDILNLLSTTITDRTLRNDLNVLEQKQLVKGKGHTHTKVWVLAKE